MRGIRKVRKREGGRKGEREGSYAPPETEVWQHHWTDR